MSTMRKIAVRRTDALRAYSNNARQHSKAQLKKLKRSIHEFGWINPLIIDENGMVLCGHGRLAAAIELGIEEVPTVEIGHMSEEQKRAYIIADNRIAEQASWSKSLLRDELQGLADAGFELELTGLDTIEIDEILSLDDPESSVDDDVDLTFDYAQPLCEPGDCWQIGDHRRYVGDARDPVAYKRLLKGERAQLIFTDPPYGCAIAGNVSGLGKVKHGDFVMGAGETSLSEFASTILRPAFKQIALHARSGAIAFVCTDWRAAPHLD